MKGFCCLVLLTDVRKNETLDSVGEYVELDVLLGESDIITLHCPLTPKTHHIVNAGNLPRTKPGAMLINTSRGGLIDTRAVIGALKSGRLGNLGLDVYEEEADLFFEDLSNHMIQDDVFARLLTFPNVIITAHQAFFTREAMIGIAGTTLASISDFEQGRELTNVVKAEEVTSPAR